MISDSRCGTRVIRDPYGRGFVTRFDICASAPERVPGRECTGPRFALLNGVRVSNWLPYRLVLSASAKPVRPLDPWPARDGLHQGISRMFSARAPNAAQYQHRPNRRVAFIVEMARRICRAGLPLPEVRIVLLAPRRRRPVEDVETSLVSPLYAAPPHFRVVTAPVQLPTTRFRNYRRRGLGVLP
jgi:hypothetical protein